MPAMLLVVAREHGGQRHVPRLLLPAGDVQRDPSRQGELGALKIPSAKRCAARLSAAGVEPSPAPHGAAWALAEPVACDLTGAPRGTFWHGAISFAAM